MGENCILVKRVPRHGCIMGWRLGAEVRVFMTEFPDRSMCFLNGPKSIGPSRPSLLDPGTPRGPATSGSSWSCSLSRLTFPRASIAEAPVFKPPGADRRPKFAGLGTVANANGRVTDIGPTVGKR